MVKITISTMSLSTFCDSDTMIVILTLMPRFSARDLLMRYHWGLGVGHLHAHQPVTTSDYVGDEPDQFEVCQDDPDLEPEGTSDVGIEDGDSDIYVSDDPAIEIGDLEEWEDVETSIRMMTGSMSRKIQKMKISLECSKAEKKKAK